MSALSSDIKWIIGDVVIPIATGVLGLVVGFFAGRFSIKKSIQKISGSHNTAVNNSEDVNIKR